MTDAVVDVVVVGGGINGTGVAQAAAAAGHSVLLLEKNALASGTSSKSSKLVHGGLRYLESYEFGLVRESLAERALLLRIAPDIVRLTPFHVPVYRRTRRRPWLVRTGLSLYALLGGLSPAARFTTVPRSRWDQLDGLRTDGLDAVFRYHDGQTDDRVLTQAVMDSAMSLGAALAMPARFTGATLTRDGCEVRYDDGAERTVQARVLVNAAGPWVDRVLRRIEPVQAARPIELVQGTHIDFDARVEHGIYYVEAPRDGRAVFVIPRGNGLYVGTTETRYRGDPGNVQPLATEVRYLCKVLATYFPRLAHLGPDQVTAAWAGLRVLPAGDGHAFHRSREVVFDTDRVRRPRLVSIYGGKLTTYRRTAMQALKIVSPSLPQRRARGRTDRLPLTPR